MSPEASAAPLCRCWPMGGLSDAERPSTGVVAQASRDAARAGPARRSVPPGSPAAAVCRVPAPASVAALNPLVVRQQPQSAGTARGSGRGQSQVSPVHLGSILKPWLVSSTGDGAENATVFVRGRGIVAQIAEGSVRVASRSRRNAQRYVKAGGTNGIGMSDGRRKLSAAVLESAG